MKKTLFILAPAALVISASMAAYSAHGFHVWQKMSEQTANNGEKMCQWKCNASGYYGEEHFATTSGYGMCPQP